MITSDLHGIQVSLIIPAYNEGSHIKKSLHEISRYVSEVTDSFEIILVDDGSSDGTWNEILQTQDEIPCLTGVRLSRNFGKELAICAGLDLASGNGVIVMDADLQHPPRLIPEMVRVWQEGPFDVVECIKRSRG